MNKTKRPPREHINVGVPEDLEELQDHFEQDDILGDRALKQTVADTRCKPVRKNHLTPEKIRLLKDISEARKAEKKGKLVPPAGGRQALDS